VAATARTYISTMITRNLATVVMPTLNPAIGIITTTIISEQAVITLTTQMAGGRRLSVAILMN
jgi:hypothetical protein